MRFCARIQNPSHVLKKIFHRFALKLFDPLPERNLRGDDVHASIHSCIVYLLHFSKSSQSPAIFAPAHAFILRSGLESDTFLSNNLLRAYWSCGSVAHARLLFDRMPQRDVVSWNTMVSGYICSGLPSEGIHLFREMICAGTSPSQASFASALTASTELPSLPCFMQMHGFALKSGFGSDCCIGNAIIKGYVEMGELDDLRVLKEERSNFDEISFEILVRGYCTHGACSDAFELFKHSCFVGTGFNSFAVSSLVSMCSSLDKFDHGVQIHGHVTKLGLDVDVSVVNSLITMYSRANSLEDSVHLFDLCSLRDIVSWNSLISGFACNGRGDAGITLVGRFVSSGMLMNESTFSSFLSCCMYVSVLENAKQAHALILKVRDHNDQGSSNIILTMYCGSKALEDAVLAFESMEARDTVSFNLMMGLYRKFGYYEESMKLFPLCQLQGISMDKTMYSTTVSNCSELGLLDLGQQIHNCIVKHGFENAPQVKSSLLEMYSQCERFTEMEKIFAEAEERDIFAWNTMVIGYARCELFGKIVKIWKQMGDSSIELNEFSYSAFLSACSYPETLIMGEQIHARILKIGLVFDMVLMNSLLTMYSNCQMMKKALTVFKEICSLDSVSWNAMVSGCAQNGLPEEALKFYIAMNQNSIETSHMTFASICMSSAMLTDLKLGTQLHAQLIKRPFQSDASVSNSLIMMYAKSGNLKDSSKIFHAVANKDLVTWNSMISAYNNHGFGKEAIDLFQQMKSSGVKPNSVTLLGVLSAYGHAGLVQEAYLQFKSMYASNGVEPAVEHYACMVDILCRAGELEKAFDLINIMPFACSLVWKTLLNACKVNGDVELGEVAAKKIIELEPQDSAAYVLLSDLYASVGKRHGKAEMRRIMEDRGVKKEAGCAWISV